MRNVRRVAGFLLALAATWLGGCASLLPTPAGNQPVTTFLLAPELPSEVSSSGQGPTVLVSVPDARPGYHTPRLAYIKERYRLDYFAYHQWVDTPAAMLQPLLVSALRARRGVGAVTTGDAEGVAADLRLNTSILHLYQDFRTRPSRGSVALVVRLVDLRQGRVLAVRAFDADVPAPEDSPYGGVVAINRALARLLPQIADFAASQASKAASKRALASVGTAAISVVCPG
jgi:cholesterol transport system auxiliary component